MIHLEMSTMIYKPIEQVFNYVSTPENDVQWQYGTLATARLYKGINKIGTFFRSIGHLMGHRIQSTFEVIEYQPNSKYRFKSLSGPLHSQTSYAFEAANGGTRITISTHAHVVNFFKMDERLLGSKIKKQLKENLTNLKRLLEEQVSGIETHPLSV
jgi:uncharacterized membrane protein